MIAGPPSAPARTRTVFGARGRRAIAGILVAMATLGVSYPVYWNRSLDAARHDGAAVLTRIAWELERFYVGGDVSYSNGQGVCPGTATYSKHHGSWIPDLGIRITEDKYAYTISAVDTDGDELCDSYTITATGAVAPADTDLPLVLRSPDELQGPWPLLEP